MAERILVAVRGDLPLALAEFTAQAPDAVLGDVEHDDGCPAIGVRIGEPWDGSCTCEIVVVHVEGYVPPEVAS